MGSASLAFIKMGSIFFFILFTLSNPCLCSSLVTFGLGNIESSNWSGLIQRSHVWKQIPEPLVGPKTLPGTSLLLRKYSPFSLQQIPTPQFSSHKFNDVPTKSFLEPKFRDTTPLLPENTQKSRLRIEKPLFLTKLQFKTVRSLPLLEKNTSE